MPEAHSDTHSGARALTVIFCVVFLTYAACFLYFFVDDEAIPLVYARNLLRGRGLAYTVLEGRVEGYSDFLHVLWSTLLLATTRMLGLGPLAPLLVGKAISLAAGVGIIACTAGVLARLNLGAAARVSALTFLCLAGPLAVWSASSLETAVFALAVVALAMTVWDERLTPAVLISIFIVFERIDAPVYIAAVLIAAAIARPRRWKPIAVTAAAAGAVLVAFHAWRFLYFGSLISAPMATKVLFRVALPSGAMVKIEELAYFQSLLVVYGWPAVALLAAAVVAIRHPAGRMALAVVLILGVYVERVDDWMFGWRFAVALLPFVAIVLAIAVDRLPGGMAVAASVCVCLWSAATAYGFLRVYQVSEKRPIFWLSPRGGEAVWLGRYDELVTAAGRLMHPGDRIAFNQAGIVPYLLDVENIDDLGICSAFIAKLPTTDVYYTGVGRYSPVTNAPILRTAHAYLLHHDIRFLITPRDLIVKANGDRVPDVVLDGAFERVDAGPLSDNVIYRRTDKPIDRFARDPDVFTENVAHASHVLRAALDGRALSPEEAGPKLPFLRELGLSERFSGSRTYDIGFAQGDESVSTIYVRAVSSQVPGTLTIALDDDTGREVYRTEIGIGPQATTVLEPLPAGLRASALSLAIRAPGGGRFALEDVRVDGQSGALRRYIRQRLRLTSARMVQLPVSVSEYSFAPPPPPRSF